MTERKDNARAPQEALTEIHPTFDLVTDLLDNYAQIRPQVVSKAVYNHYHAAHPGQALGSRETPEFRTRINGKTYIGKITEQVILDESGKIVRTERAYMRSLVMYEGTSKEQRGRPEPFFHIRPEGACIPATGDLYNDEGQEMIHDTLQEISAYYYREYGKQIRRFDAA